MMSHRASTSSAPGRDRPPGWSATPTPPRPPPSPPAAPLHWSRRPCRPGVARRRPPTTPKAPPEPTAGAFALVEASVPPGGGPPPHLHTREDEAFYLLDGELQ